MLGTLKSSKETVSALQRKLYLKAKHQPTFRFYSLYDKVYRSDVLQRAYALVRQNKGSPGIDGETRPLGIPCIKDRIVQMAVKRVIEPIFEADFSPHSYGFRPKNQPIKRWTISRRAC